MRAKTATIIGRRIRARLSHATGKAALSAGVVLAPLGTTPLAKAVTYTAANTFGLFSSPNNFSRATGTSGNQQVGWGADPNSPHALLWSGTAASLVDLDPSFLLGSNSSSKASGVFGNQQVGYGSGSNIPGADHALLWNGTAASVIDLNPALLGSSSFSIANGTSGNQQVGYGFGSSTAGNGHALLWSGTAASAIDLNPDLLGSNSSSVANGTSGTQQVGSGSGSSITGDHALLWSGTAASAVDLNPSSLLGSNVVSIANGVCGNQQVGVGSTTSIDINQHALLWTGTAASAIDLTPMTLLGSGAISVANATSGSQQVGYGSGSNTGGNNHALVWSGTAASAIDLHGLLQPGSFTSSVATSIDAYGNIVGYENIPGQSGGTDKAVEWLAGDMYNVGGTGTWSDGSNWTAGMPSGGNDVLLLQQDAANRTITYTGAAASSPLGNITIDATGSGTMTVSQTFGTLSSTTEIIGLLGHGAFVQSAGTHLTGTITLAARPGSQGSYSLSGSGVLNANTIILNPGGSFDQTGGTLVSDFFFQQGGTVTGTLTNQGTFIYFGGTFSGRLVNYGTATLNAAFSPGNGIENDGTLAISATNPLTVNGSGLDNFGALALNGGLLSGSGPVTNDVGGVMTAHGTIAQSFANYGQLSTSGLLVLNSASTNYGSIAMSGGQGLRANAAFTNAGSIALGGGSISGGGVVTNGAGGFIHGGGGISNPVNNSGGIIQADANSTLVIDSLTGNTGGGRLVVAPGAQLNVLNGAFSTGSIQLQGAGANLSGGAIANTGTIRGSGQVSNVVLNNGVIRPEGGELDLTASGSTNAPAFSGPGGNTPAGQIQAPAATTVFFTAGLAENDATIALSGGTFDNNNAPINNTGSIEGNGVFRSGGLTNASAVIGAGGSPAGVINITDAATSFYGPVSNSAGASIKIVSNTTTFFGPVTNNGTIKVTSGVARFLGNGVSMTVGGTYNSDPSDNYFNGLAIIGGGMVTGGSGDRFFLTGGSALTNAGAFLNGGTLSTNAVTSSGTFTQTGTLTQAGNFTNTGTATIGGTQTWSAGTHLINNAGTTTLNSDAGVAGANLSVDVAGGSVTLNSTQRLSALSITGGKVDLTSQKMIVTTGAVGTWNGSAYTGISGFIQSARNGGAWNGSGLTTSQPAALSELTTLGVAAAGDVGKSNFAGYSVSASDVLVMYTYAGDADLNGAITGDDYFRIDSGFGSALRGYENGDFNYDGKINADDYFIIDRNYSRQGMPFSAASALGGIAAVPEPGSIALVGVGMVVGSLRRKRRWRASLSERDDGTLSLR